MTDVDLLFTAAIAAVIVVGNWLLEPTGKRRSAPTKATAKPPRPEAPPPVEESASGLSLTAAAPRPATPPPPRLDPTRRMLLRLKDVDPNFSLPLLADFVLALVGRYHAVRGGDSPSPLVPWLSPHLAQGLRLRRARSRETGTTVQGVVVGELRLRILDVRRDFTMLSMDVKSSFVERGGEAAEEICLEERWFLRRRNDLLSGDPDTMREPGCPRCGFVDDEGEDPEGRCPGCHELVPPGRHGWCVTEIDQLARTPRSEAPIPETLAVLDPDRPLVQAVDYAAQRRDFGLRHPDFLWPDFAAWVGRLWLHLGAAWAEGAWTKARPFETDRVFQSHLYRLALIRSRGWAEWRHDAEVLAVEPARFEWDAWFERVTVRVAARCRGGVGPATPPPAEDPTRFHLVYWTFLRRREGARGTGIRSFDACPVCRGSLAQIDLFGDCPACGARITGGEGAWVLAGVDDTGHAVF